MRRCTLQTRLRYACEKFGWARAYQGHELGPPPPPPGRDGVCQPTIDEVRASALTKVRRITAVAFTAKKPIRGRLGDSAEEALRTPCGFRRRTPVGPRPVLLLGVSVLKCAPKSRGVRRFSFKRRKSDRTPPQPPLGSPVSSPVHTSGDTVRVLGGELPPGPPVSRGDTGLVKQSTRRSGAPACRTSSKGRSAKGQIAHNG